MHFALWPDLLQTVSAITFVRQGEFLLLQFNTGCGEALPVCQAMCCRMRRFYSVELSATEEARLKHRYFEGKVLLEGTPEGDCVYLKGNRCSIYEDRPKQCREWHCSPHGGLTDPEITKREHGWVLFPAKEAK